MDSFESGATVEVETPVGPARFVAVGPANAAATLVLGHGAGGGIAARDLSALAAGLPSAGIRVVLVEQPWVVAGKRIAPAPARLDAAWTAVLPAITRSGRLIVGGRSAGARVACRTASSVGADAVVALAFPLHPPGKPDKSRVDELAGVECSRLVVQGTRDPFGSGDEIRAALGSGLGVEIVDVPGADHGFRVPAGNSITQAEALQQLAAAVRVFCSGG